MPTPQAVQSRELDPQASPRVRLLLADDHSGVREETRQLLEPDFEVLRAVADGTELLAAAAELRADAIISDVQMPNLGGIEAGGRILKDGLCETVVVLSMYPDAYLVKAALAVGIRGYVLKVDASDELIPAIHAALRGEQYLSRGVHFLVS